MEKDTAVTIHVKSTTVSPDAGTPFIDLVVCPSFESAYKKDIIEYYGMDKYKYVNDGSFSPTKQSNDSDDPRELFQSITHDVNEIFIKIKVKTQSQDVPEIVIDYSKGVFTNDIIIKTKYYARFGRCFSIGPAEDIIKLGVYRITFETTMNIWVYFSHPGQFLHVNTNTKVYNILHYKSIKYYILLKKVIIVREKFE